MKLDPIIQEIIGEVNQYVTGLKNCTEALGGFSKKVGESDSLVNQLSRAVGDLHGEAVKFGQAARGIGDSARASFAALDKEFKLLKSDLEGTTRATDAQTASMKRLMAVSGVGGGTTTGATAAQLAYMRSQLGIGPGTTGATAAQLQFMRGQLGLGAGTTGATPAQVALIKSLSGVNDVARRMGLNPNASDMIFGMGQGARPFRGIGDIFGARAGGSSAMSDMTRRMGLNLNGPDVTGLMSYNAPISAVFRGPMLGKWSTTTIGEEHKKLLQKEASKHVDFLMKQQRAAQEKPGDYSLFGGLKGAVLGGLGTAAGAVGTAGLAAGVIGAGAVVLASIYAVKKAIDGVETAAGLAKTAIGEMLSSGMEMQKYQTTFGVLVGDVGKGKALFGELQSMSVVSPFAVDKLAETSQILLGMGVRGDDLTAVLGRLGDVATGDASKLKRLAVVYGEVLAEGKITGWRIRQLASLGVGVEDLAQTMGVQGGVLRAMMTGGGGSVPGDILTRTINRITEPGGRFAGISQQQVMGTTGGQMDRMVNTVGVLAQKMGDAFLKSSGLSDNFASISEAIAGATDWATKFAGVAGMTFRRIVEDATKVGEAVLAAFGVDGDLAMSIPTLKEVEATVDRVFGSMLDWIEKVVVSLSLMVSALDKDAKKMNEILSFGGQWRKLTKNDPILGQRPENFEVDTGMTRTNRIGQFFAGLRNGMSAADAAAAGFIGPLMPPSARLPGPGRPAPYDISKLGSEAAEMLAGSINPAGGKGLNKLTPLDEFKHTMDVIKEAQFGPVAYRKFLSDWEKAEPGAVNPTFPGLSPQDARGLTGGAFEKLRDSLHIKDMAESLPMIAHYGSQEAAETINKTMADGVNVQDQVLDILKIAADEAKRQTEVQNKIADQLADFKGEDF